MINSIITLIFLLALGARVGGRRFPALPLFARTALGSLIVLALMTVVGSALFAVFGQFGMVLVTLTILLTMAIAWIVPLRPLQPHEDEIPDEHASAFFSPFVLGCAVLVLDAAMLWIFYRSRTLDPIPSPWTVVPHEIFFLFPIAVLGAIVVARRARMANFSYLVTVATALAALLPAFLIYPLGFSFDSALHRAAEQVLVETGKIQPLPLYYLGEYALMTVLGRVTGVSVDLLGRFFLPVLTAFSAPALVVLALGSLRRRASALAAALFFLLIPFGEFVSTLPQGLANLFAFGAFASGLASLTAGRSLRLPLVFTLAAAVTHPLTGIPAIIFFVVLWLNARSGNLQVSTPKRRGGLKTSATTAILAVFASLSLPAAFLANAWRTGDFGLSVQNRSLGEVWKVIFTVESPHLRRFDLIWDTLYRFEAILPMLIILIAFIATSVYKNEIEASKALAMPRVVSVFGNVALIMAVNFIILKYMIRFDFLPAFEQGNYSARLFGVIMLLLLPLALISIAKVFTALPKTRLAPRAVLLVTLALAMTATFYISYPRFDAYASNHGRNTSRYDLETASWIHQDAGDRPHVVLAPPPTSAAALKLYGFQAYYHDLFYYPLPVAGPLYQTFVELVEETVTRDAIESVRARTGVHRIYLAIPAYWTRAPPAITEAKSLAARWTDVAGGKIHIFVFE